MTTVDWDMTTGLTMIRSMSSSIWLGEALRGGQQGVDENALPAVMEVDYIRVFKNKKMIKEITILGFVVFPLHT